jgi:hypothetical protein
MGKKTALDIPLSIVQLLITPSHYKNAGALPNSVAGEEGNRSGISP